MTELKVTSKKYNDKDILQVEGDVLPVKLSVTNIESLSDSEIDSLKVGDVVQKKTGNQKHCYIVTYKEEKHGICLSYTACGYMETISYDYTNGHWVFNSKDVQETQSKLVSGTNIKTINNNSLLGSGNIAISGGTQKYKHFIQIMDTDPVLGDVPVAQFYYISNSSTNRSGDLLGFLAHNICEDILDNNAFYFDSSALKVSFQCVIKDTNSNALYYIDTTGTIQNMIPLSLFNYKCVDTVTDY